MRQSRLQRGRVSLATAGAVRDDMTRGVGKPAHTARSSNDRA